MTRQDRQRVATKTGLLIDTVINWDQGAYVFPDIDRDIRASMATLGIAAETKCVESQPELGKEGFSCDAKTIFIITTCGA